MRRKRLIIIGDRVLIKPDDKANQKTKTGLYLPQGVAAKESVQSGYVVEVGPGIPMPGTTDSDVPWEQDQDDLKFMPMQVEEGDLAIFLSRFAHQVEYESESYFIVPQAGILMVIREEFE